MFDRSPELTSAPTGPISRSNRDQWCGPPDLATLKPAGRQSSLIYTVADEGI